MGKGLLERIFGTSTKKHPVKKKHKFTPGRKRVRNKFYLYKIDEHNQTISNVPSALREHITIEKAKYTAQKIARTSFLPVYIIRAPNLRKAESDVLGYREDLDHPDEYPAYNRAVRSTVCYYNASRTKQTQYKKRKRHHVSRKR